MLFEQAFVGFGELDWIEVFSLNVFDECQLERVLGRYVFDDDENVFQACTLRCAPATFTGDDLVFVNT